MIPLLEEDNTTTSGSSGTGEPGAATVTETSVPTLELNADNATTFGNLTENSTSLNGSDLDNNSTENATETGLSESSSFSLLVSESATDPSMLNATAAEITDLIEQNKKSLSNNITHDNTTKSDNHNDLINDTHEFLQVETNNNDLKHDSTSDDNVMVDIEEITTENDKADVVNMDTIETERVYVTEITHSDSDEEMSFDEISTKEVEVSTEEVDVTSNEFENLESNYDERHELARSRSLKLEEVDYHVCHKEFCV